MESRYKVLGVDDSESVCSCCGRTGLKRVVWLLDSECISEPAPYGTTCAAKLVSGRKTMRASEAAATIDDGQNDMLQSIWLECVESAAAPAVSFGINRYGVTVAICGHHEAPYSELRDREHFAKSAVRSWYAQRALELAKIRGIKNPSSYAFLRIAANEVPAARVIMAS